MILLCLSFIASNRVKTALNCILFDENLLLRIVVRIDGGTSGRFWLYLVKVSGVLHTPIHNGLGLCRDKTDCQQSVDIEHIYNKMKLTVR
jgi:hypothetical protein